jgi:hypothetical protein
MDTKEEEARLDTNFDETSLSLAPKSSIKTKTETTPQRQPKKQVTEKKTKAKAKSSFNFRAINHIQFTEKVKAGTHHCAP